MSAGQSETRLSTALLATEPDPAVLARSGSSIYHTQSGLARPEKWWTEVDDCQRGTQQGCMWDILGELDEPDEPCPICFPSCSQNRSLVRSRSNVDRFKHMFLHDCNCQMACNK